MPTDTADLQLTREQVEATIIQPLLPERPRPDLVELAQSCGVEFIHRRDGNLRSRDVGLSAIVPRWHPSLQGGP